MGIGRKAPVITPGGRVGDDRSTGSRANGENWVERRGGLPKYIRIVRNALMRKGKSERAATAIAVATIKRWARGGGNVSPKVRAAAVRALAQWEAMKASKGLVTDDTTPSGAEWDQGDLAMLKELGLGAGVASNSGTPFVHNTEENGISGSAAKSTGDEMKIEHKAVPVSGVSVVDDKTGLVETIVSVTGIVDNVNDIIEPGAYAKTLATRTPKGVWSHDWNTPVSRTEHVKELMPGDEELPKTLPNGSPWPEGAGALKVLTRFNLDTQRGRDAYSDVKFFGAEQEWSIGYNVPAGAAVIDQKAGVRRIKHLELFEYSPVLWGAMGAARTSSVKSAQGAHMAYKSMFGDDYYVKMDMEHIDEFMSEVKSVLDDGDNDDSVEDEPFPELDAELNNLMTQSKGALSADSVHLVKRAIDVLTELLDTMAGGSPAAEAEEKGTATGAKGLYEAVVSLKNIGTMNEAMSDDLLEQAIMFDDALDENDVDSLKDSATTILDVIATNIDAVDEETSTGMKSIADSIYNTFTKMADEVDEEDDEEEEDEEATDPEADAAGVDKEDDDEEDGEEVSGEKVHFDTTELKSYRDFLDSLS